MRKICLLLILLSSLSSAKAGRPNILLILLDDSGWTDLGCYGSRIDTPNIDRLARQGMRFTDCHSAAPNCSPSRAGLLTGRTPSRVGVYSYLPANHPMHLKKSEITVAELLKAAGYRTGHFGKWHLSKLISDQPQPDDQGFEYSLGTDNNASPSHLNPGNFVRNGVAVGEIKGYSCDIVVDETIQWLNTINAGSNPPPFFACVWFHEPHTPIASPPDLVAKYQERYPELSKKHATYHANIENVDRAVGRLLRGLDRLDVAEDTFVFFTSDNGPLNDFSRTGLRGRKSHVWEGGHRVPGIVRWPGHVEPGSECSEPVSGVDFMPTACAIAGVHEPDDRVIDGTSIVPLLRGQAFQRRRPLYWYFYRLTPAVAFRDGDWVVIADTNDRDRPKTHSLASDDMSAIKHSKLRGFQLYNLGSDLRQRTDLATAEPTVLDRLVRRLRRFHAGVIKDGPVWNVPSSVTARQKPRIWTSE